MTRAQLPWFASLKVGDVIEDRTGRGRVVRSVARFDNGDLRSITLAIRRCSWTHRPYTVINFTDIIQRGFRLLPLNVPLRTKADRQLQRQIADHCARGLDCCDVKGWP